MPSITVTLSETRSTPLRSRVCGCLLSAAGAFGSCAAGLGFLGGRAASLLAPRGRDVLWLGVLLRTRRKADAGEQRGEIRTARSVAAGRQVNGCGRRFGARTVRPVLLTEHVELLGWNQLLRARVGHDVLIQQLVGELLHAIGEPALGQDLIAAAASQIRAFGDGHVAIAHLVACSTAAGVPIDSTCRVAPLLFKASSTFV